MRTAEEIYESNVEYERCEIGERVKRSILGAIITAQKEAIEECAERAKIVRYESNPFQIRESALSNQQRDFIDKKSILSLIDELK